jgi:mono/diheme cytochrome c family protein
MRQLACFALAALILTPAGSAQSKSASAAAAQIERGRELFEKSPKGVACATCHKIAGIGTAVGPDLKDFAGVIGARAIAQSIQMSMTAYVQEVKTSSGTFPGLVQQKLGDETDVWDLSKTPPELKKLPSKDILSMASNTTWKHPPAAADYTSQELADVIAFLKNAATGAKKEVKVADVEESQ